MNLRWAVLSFRNTSGPRPSFLHTAARPKSHWEESGHLRRVKMILPAIMASPWEYSESLHNCSGIFFHRDSYLSCWEDSMRRKSVWDIRLALSHLVRYPRFCFTGEITEGEALPHFQLYTSSPEIDRCLQKHSCGCPMSIWAVKYSTVVILFYIRVFLLLVLL